MKKKILFLVIAFLMMNISLFAFDNDLFGVSSNDWDYKKGTEPNVYIFSLKDFEKEDAKSIPPQIVVQVIQRQNEYQYRKEDKEVLALTKKAAKEDAEQRLKLIKDNMTKLLKSKMPNISDRKIDELMESEVGTPEFGDPYFKMIDGHKASVVDYSINYIKIRIIGIITLTKTIAITVVCSDPTSIDSLSSYNQFISSFKAKDRQATYFNAQILPMIKYVLGSVIGMILVSVLVFYIRKNN